MAKIYYKQNRKYGNTYEDYITRFEYEKDMNNVIKGVRRYTKRQWEEKRAKHMSNKDMIDVQTKVSEKTKQQLAKDLAEGKFKTGRYAFVENSWFGRTEAEVELSQDRRINHRTLKAYLGDDYAVHYVIAARIASGEEEAEVLADYGYQRD